jgi:hypothetical protein
MIWGSSAVAGVHLIFYSTMPEMPEVQGFVHLIQCGKDFVLQKHYNELKVCYTTSLSFPDTHCQAVFCSNHPYLFFLRLC